MTSIWAVARETFAQCLRMKVAGLFVIALVATLVALPFLVRDEATLAGRTQTFLSYSTSSAAALLSVVTIFMAVSLISGDIREKYIFTLATKPLGRWQYILGRWLGVVLLDALLLAGAGVGIYAAVMALRQGRALNPTDRRVVETEIFTARRSIAPDRVDDVLDKAVAQRVERLRQQGRYEDTLDSFAARMDGNREEGYIAMLSQLRTEELSRLESAAPGGSLSWRFSGIDVAAQAARAEGTLSGIDRASGLLRIEVDPALAGKLVHGGPVRVNEIDGRAIAVRQDRFDVQFSQEAISRGAVADLAVGDTVAVGVDPTVQVTYKATAAEAPPDELLYSMWIVPTPPFYQEMRSDPPKIPATLTLSARLVGDDGRIGIRYFNLPGPSGYRTTVTIRHQDIAMLYRTASFGGNFVRAMLIIQAQLMFLAALGTLAGSFLSFSVGSLVCFVVLPFSLARGFLSQAVALPRGGEGVDPFTFAGHYVFKLMAVLLPDFTSVSPADALVGGMNIAWDVLTSQVGINVVVRCGLALALACVIFHKRELARVQVQ